MNKKMNQKLPNDKVAPWEKLILKKYHFLDNCHAKQPLTRQKLLVPEHDDRK